MSLRLATAADAPVMLDIIHRAFSARPAVDPPAAALDETVESVVARIDTGAGLLLNLDGIDVACLLISFEDDDIPTAMVHRVSVLPGHRAQGVAAALVRAAAELVTDAGMKRLQLMARAEFPHVIEWWRSYGFEILREVELGYIMAQRLPVRIEVPSTSAMHELGRRLARVLEAGDVIVATGELGAGKTTLTQGIGAGLGVAGAVISPTFVLSRIHPSVGGVVDLVHVDAYRLNSAAELEDLDLEASLATSVTLIEWGDGLVRDLANTWLDVTIRRSDDPSDDTRVVYIAGIGERWAGVDLEAELGGGDEYHLGD